MKKDSQQYSRLAIEYIKRRKQNGDYWLDGVYYGDLDVMEDLADLFGWEECKSKDYIERYGIGGLHRKRFQFVLDKLDYESSKPDALMHKMYINYPGIINKPTRCFIIKEELK